MEDRLPLLHACLRETRSLRTKPRHALPRRSRRQRPAHRPTTNPSGLLLGVGALLLALAVPATVQGLQPVPVAEAEARAPLAPPAPARSIPRVVPPAPTATSASVGSRASATSKAAATPSDSAGAVPVRRQAGVPVRVTVPAVGIDTQVSGLGLRRDGSMRVPRDPQKAAWYERGPRPGEPGPALIVGHVDSTEGPGAFFPLRRVDPGDRIHVRDEHGRETTFVVEKVSEYRKDRFPTERVFTGVSGPELRLITCSGSFNRITRHYSHNLVVYARLATGAGA